MLELNSKLAIAWFETNYMKLKGTVMQIEKALINDRLRVSKVS